jgi:glucose-fructose oxidoreductase
VRYAVVGLGHIAQTAALPAFEHAAENSTLAALVSDDVTKRAELAAAYGVSATYSYAEFEHCLRSGEIDAVYISLPNHLHRQYAVQAAEAGIHVLCEKPMAPTEADCAAMIEAAERHRVKLMIAYRLHFEEANLSTVDLVQSGRLGDVRIFDSVFTMDIEDPSNIRLSPIADGGGTLYDTGIYCINAARYLFQDEPLEVIGFSASSGDPRFRNCDEMTSAVLRFPKQRLATFTTSFGAIATDEYRVVGQKGSVRMSPAYHYALPLQRELFIDGHTERQEFAPRDQFGPEFVYFSNCIQRDEQPEPSGHEGLADVRVIRAIYASAAAGGQPVQLPPFRRDQRPTLAQSIHRPPVQKPREVHAHGPSS